MRTTMNVFEAYFRDHNLSESLANGADPDDTMDGYTLLHFAVRRGDENAVRLLLNNGANPTLTSDETDMEYPGTTALHMAAHLGLVPIVRMFLQYMDVNHTDAFHQTPLHFAVRRENRDMLQLLVDAEANPEICDTYGLKPGDNVLGDFGATLLDECLAGRQRKVIFKRLEQLRPKQWKPRRM